MRLGWFGVLALSSTLGWSCRGTTRCATDERFDESGACVPVSSCPSGRDPETGVCTGGTDSGVADGGTTDSGELVRDGGMDAGGCVEDCGSRFCVPELHACGDCLENSHCPSNTPYCSPGQGQCLVCANDDQCAGRVGEPACDEASGSCVMCTPDSETVTCDPNTTCHPTNFACTGQTRETLQLCMPCISDSECIPLGPANAIVRCAFGFCLADRDTSGGAACPAGYQDAQPGTSALGVSGTYCMPRSVTTCAAIRAAVDNSICNFDDDCGTADGQPDGICLPTNRCSVQCENDDGCPVGGTTCNTTASPPRCE